MHAFLWGPRKQQSALLSGLWSALYTLNKQQCTCMATAPFKLLLSEKEWELWGPGFSVTGGGLSSVAVQKPHVEETVAARDCLWCHCFSGNLLRPLVAVTSSTCGFCTVAPQSKTWNDLFGCNRLRFSYWLCSMIVAVVGKYEDKQNLQQRKWYTMWNISSIFSGVLQYMALKLPTF